MTETQLKQHPVILTRTGAVNQRLALRFSKLGFRTFAWPAFTIRLPEDETPVVKRFSDLSDIDLVLLVSPASVAAVAHWVDHWPSHVTLATVGEGTARVARAAWGESVPIIYPAGDAAHSGSEALMAELRKRGIPSRVLICRGQTGREWLSEELLSEGADVRKLMCYERLPLQLTVQQEDELREAMKGPAPVTYITSSEAIVSLLRAVHPVEGAWEWITSGAVVVIHPRSESKVLEAGFHLVRMSSPIDDEVEKNVIACAEGLG